MNLSQIRQQYPQYQDLSDEQLAGALHTRFYSDMPRDEFNRKIGLAAPTTPTQQVDPVADVVQSAGAGLRTGAINTLGSVGDVRELGRAGAQAAGGAAGLPSWYSNEAFNRVLGALPLPARGIMSIAPTSAEGQTAANTEIGPAYRPQTTAGQYARTIGEFAPGAILPARTVAARAVGGVVAPGVGSEAAGQATEGTAAEPYARVAGALAGGGLGAAMSRGGNAPRAAIPSAEERIEAVRNAASAGYQSPEIAAVQFRPGVVDALANTTLRQLDRGRFNDRIAPGTRAILDDMRTPINGARHTIEDLQTTRQQLERLAGNFANPTEQAAASQAIQNLTRYIERMPQGHLAAGDAAAASGAWNTARQNYSAAMTAEKVQNKLTAAENQAQSANSGMNVGNATRQRLRTLINNPKQARGMSEAEGELIENTVQGSRLGNALRYTGNMLGGGGGLGSTLLAAAGGAGTTFAGLGPIGALLPIAGVAARKAGNALTTRQANNIVDAILSRAPEMQNIQQQGQRVLSQRQRELLAAQLLLPTSAQALRQPVNQ